MPNEKICRVSGRKFFVFEEDLLLLEQLSPIIAGERIALPAPTLCPDERKRRRLSFRNERKLYHTKCAHSGKPIVSIYSADKPVVVYAKDVFWSDAWDARSYGREFNFSRTFFEQFADLLREVPRAALISSFDADENNCVYINYAGASRNCYMTFDSDYNEDSLYSNVLKHSKSCMDCSYVYRSELCYECVDCKNCYHLCYSQDCTECSEGSFLQGCIGCRNCFMCTNLIGKSYCIENTQFTRADYETRMGAIDFSSRSSVRAMREKFSRLNLQHPRKFARILKAENCIGDYIANAKNAFLCFNIGEVEDVRYCDSLYGAKTCMDVSSFGEGTEYCYECSTVGVNSQNIFFTQAGVSNCNNVFYSAHCVASRDIFGCSSLRRGQYCILNKQYSKDEFDKLALKIVRHMQETGEWGEFFPISLSPFGYNETIAHEVFPLDQAAAAKLWAKWSTYENPRPTGTPLSASEVPDAAQLLNDTHAQAVIDCEYSHRPFRISRAELDFYRRQSIPLPTLHPDERHHRRLMLRNPQRLWQRRCAKTGEGLWTSYPPESPYLIYGEKAYLDACG